MGAAGWCAWGWGVCMGWVAGGSEADRFVWLRLLLSVLARRQVGLSWPAPLPPTPGQAVHPFSSLYGGVLCRTVACLRETRDNFRIAL